MDAATLRELQAPLKQRYRDDPLSSRTPLDAVAFFETDGITTSVQTWSGPVRAGLHPATGGTEATPAPATCCCRPCSLARG